jgi:hypothetical protein
MRGCAGLRESPHRTERRDVVKANRFDLPDSIPLDCNLFVLSNVFIRGGLPRHSKMGPFATLKMHFLSFHRAEMAIQ